jgi:ABC-type Na+ efflux pump, permease component
MGVLSALVVKDLREILTSRYFLVSLAGGFAVLVALGAVLGASIRETATGMQKFAVVLNGTTDLGMRFVEKLRLYGGELHASFSPDLLRMYGYVVVVPQNFTFPARVEVYVRYRGLVSVAPPYVLDAAAAEAAREVGIPPRLLNVTTLVYIDGARLTEADISVLFSLFMLSWVFMLMVPLLVAATAAVAMGVEKEKRTFELILSTPATPNALIAAKLVSSVILALIQFAVMAVGMIIYLSNVVVIETSPAAAAARPFTLSISLSPSLLAPMALSTLALSIAVLALSLLVATRTEDIKTAQSVVPSVVLPLLLPAFAALYAPVDAFETYPFVHPLAIATAAVFGRWDKVYLYLAVDWALAAAAVLAVSRLMTAEYLVAGGRRRR